MINRIKYLIATTIERMGYTIVPNWRLKTYPQEQYLRRLFRELEIDCVFDVGANIGQYHDFIRNDVGFEGMIVSFEPIPSNVEILREKAKSDNKWIIEGYALGASSGNAFFNVMSTTEFSSFLEPDNSVIRRFSQGNSVKERITVEVKTLDQAVAELEGRIEFAMPYLKLDTQGFDLEVVRGAHSSIRKFKALQTEASIKPIYAGMPNYLSSVEEFRAIGFELSGMFPVNDVTFPLLIEVDCHMISKDVCPSSVSI